MQPVMEVGLMPLAGLLILLRVSLILINYLNVYMRQQKRFYRIRKSGKILVMVIVIMSPISILLRNLIVQQF